jgi:hypothetical protein
MLNSPILEAAIGLVFVNSLFSLLVSAVNEASDIGVVSQGAPLWFDLLNKIANLRATGAPPEVAGKPA